MGGGCTDRDGRPSLSESVEQLAERADSLGAARRAGDLRAVAQHLRAKEGRRAVVDVRLEAITRRRRPATRRARLRAVLRGVPGALRRRVR
jgi:hypothetical protein